MTSETTDAALAAAKSALTKGNFDAAIPAFAEVLAADPAHYDALVGAAQAYQYFNRLDQIVDIYRRGVESGTDNPEVHAGYIEALLANYQVEEARQFAERTIAKFPDALRPRLLKAQVELVRGNRDTAISTYWDCLKLDPGNVDCGLQLSQLADTDELPHLLTELEPRWKARDDLDDWNASTLGYALGRIHERMKNYDAAWEAFSFGAQKRRKVVTFEETVHARTPEIHRQFFSALSPAADAAARPGAGHVFIVSLPRSGSTLVEQILTSHPQAESIGERSFVYDTVTKWQKDFGGTPQALFSDEAQRGCRAFYQKQARAAVSNPDAMIIDKSITNYIFLGFIRTMLPGARFIQVVRDPKDTAVSCFATSFYAGSEWSYDLSEIGRNIRRYQKLMKYWMAQWPDEILTVKYEDLVQKPEEISRELVAFCGLEWDHACLEFYKTDRPVLTASINQVREPIYKRARGRASHYENHLGPLVAAMGRRAADPDWFKT